MHGLILAEQIQEVPVKYFIYFEPHQLVKGKFVLTSEIVRFWQQSVVERVSIAAK